MPEIITALEKRAMTAVVNTREMGKKALSDLLFPLALELNLTHEWVHVDELTGQAGMAPFVHKNGKAVAVDQLNGQSYMLETPNISIKRAITCSEDLLKRRAGEVVFSENGDDVYLSAVEAQITADLVHMEELIRNRIEWMVAHLIQGSISYTNDETGASFEITTAKPAGNTFTVSDLWDGSDPSPLQDILSAEDIVQPFSAPGFDIAICGTNAARAIYKMLEEGRITAIKTDSGITAGSGDFTKKFQGNGLRYIATLNGIPFYQYAGTDGEGNPLIRTDYVEFLSTDRSDMRVLYNGAKTDINAILSHMHIGRRFSYSDIDTDVGTYVGYNKARPMPWFKRPDWFVSMKVT